MLKIHNSRDFRVRLENNAVQKKYDITNGNKLMPNMHQINKYGVEKKTLQ